jgi:hypothetical protein
MEDDLKILKVEYLSNHWSDLIQILTYANRTKPKCTEALNKDDLGWKTTTKY